MPGEETDLTSCHLDLAARGIALEPTIRETAHTDSHPNLDCDIDDPVWLKSPVMGLELYTSNGEPDEEVLASCPLAHALADTALDVMPELATGLLHMGTYNCRVISGTNTLSEHSFANAIDIYGFQMADGDYYTLVEDWEHNTSKPVGEAASWRYETAYRWHEAELWNIILTPNYNTAHDNHFHVDLTAGSDYIGAHEGSCSQSGPLDWY